MTKKLNELSPEARKFFMKTKCDMSKTIDEVQNFNSCNKKDDKDTPLTYALDQRNEIVCQELLDNGANMNAAPHAHIPPLMLAILLDTPWALEMMFNHQNSKTLKFNYHCETLTGNLQMYQKNDTPLILALKAAFKNYDWTCDEEEFDTYKRVLQTFLSQEGVDTNYHHRQRNGFLFLCAQFANNCDYMPYRLDFFFDVMQEFINRGVDINFKNIKNKTAISHLLDFTNFEEDDENHTIHSFQEEIIAALKIMFRQPVDVELNIFANYKNSPSGTPLMVALRLNLPKVIKFICDEIRAQALKKLWLIRNDKSLKEMDELNCLEQFISGHAHLEEGSNVSEIYNQCSEILKQEVSSFARSMSKASNKKLKNIIFSKDLQEQLKKADFSMEEDWTESSSVDISVLEFASTHGLKEIIWTLAIQPDFHKTYDEKQLKQCLHMAIKYNHAACVDSLLHFLPENTLTLALQMAAQYRHLGLIKFIIDKYKSLRIKQKPDFEIIVPNYQFSVLSEILKIRNNHYALSSLLEELKILTLRKAYQYSSSEHLKETNLPVKERMQKFVVQYIGKHQPEHATLVFKRVVDPILKYHKSLQKQILALKFYETRIVADKARKGKHLIVPALKQDLIAHIYSYLKGPYKADDHAHYMPVCINAAKTASQFQKGTIQENKENADKADKDKASSTSNDNGSKKQKR